jgi:uncharacterized protein YdeI (YjbR/CyaY-like superfamily)
MNVNQKVYYTSRREWRSWLSKHYRSKQGVCSVFHKKLSGNPPIFYDEAVEEAICYGWIDSQVKRINEERFLLRFMPRHQRSSWSKTDKRRALRMLRERKMTQADLKPLPREEIRRRKSRPPEQRPN